MRIGFNPGELVDFVPGRVGLDLYGDDLSRMKKESVRAKEDELPMESEP